MCRRLSLANRQGLTPGDCLRRKHSLSMQSCPRLPAAMHERPPSQPLLRVARLRMALMKSDFAELLLMKESWFLKLNRPVMKSNVNFHFSGLFAAELVPNYDVPDQKLKFFDIKFKRPLLLTCDRTGGGDHVLKWWVEHLINMADCVWWVNALGQV